jgi:threonine dehydrogenase-like Zn-dependent dehydrogenase
MQALFYHINPLGWGTCKWLRHFWRGCLVSGLNGLTLRDVPAPELPGDDWVRVRTLLGGICGSDVALLAQRQPPNSILQAYSSLPAGWGHENLAVVSDAGSAAGTSWLGRRVCVDPTLCCEVRGIHPPCARCRAGLHGACENFAADGLGAAKLPPGSSIGYNTRTGGSFGEYFVAHVSRLVPVPDELPDELAALTDPVGCALHAVLRADLAGVERVLIYGAGVLGLSAVACLRAVGYAGRIDALDVHDYLRPIAAAAGADHFLRLPADDRGRFERVAERTGGRVHRVRFGNYALSGGYDAVFDCLGSRRSLNESLKWARSRGQVVLVGTGHGGRVDLTSIWFAELTVLGAYGRQKEHYQDRRVDTYRLVHELMAAGKLDVRGLLTHTFRLGDYRQAMTVAMNKARHQAVKVAFDFR